MRFLYTLPLKLRSLFRRRQVEQDLDDELAFYLEQRTAHEISLGRSPQEAARIARLALDGIDRRKEECRDARGTQALEHFIADLRQGLRGWRKTPGIWLLATVTLGLGIGANSSTFSLFEAIFHSPLANLDLDTDVTINAVQTSQGRLRNANTLDEYRLWRTSPGIDLAVAFRPHESVITGTGEPERLNGQAVSPDFFRLLNARPAIGSFPEESQHRTGATQSIVVSDSYWRNRLRSDPNVIGQTLRLDEIPYTIAAVAGPDFWFPDVRAAYWIPLSIDPTPTSYAERNLRIVARRKQGISAPDLEADLQTRFAQEAARHPDTHSGWSLRVEPAHQGFYSNSDFQVRLLLYLISGGVLLIACANVANLLLARGFARNREMSIRTALGASRSRIFLQSLTESLWIAMPAGVLAMIGGRVAAQLLLANIHVPFTIPKDFIDPRYLAFHGAVALTSVLIFGLFPAWSAARKLSPGIPQDGGPRTTLGASASRFSKALVVVQISLGLALVMTAATALRGVQILTNLDPGYDHSQVVRTAATTARLKPASDSTVRTQILDRLKTSSAITAAGWIGVIPGATGSDGSATPAEAIRTPLHPDKRPTAFTIAATAGAIETLRIPLQQGRLFDARDSATSERVAIVNRNLCDQLLPGRDPLGESIRLDALDSQPFRIIGVFANLRRADAKKPSAPQAFLLAGQAPSKDLLLVARYTREAEAFEDIRNAIRSLDAQAPIDLHTLDRDIHDGMQNGRVLAQVVTTLAGLALFFGACGLFAVISQSVVLRRPEIGVRLALGASPASIRGMIFNSGLRLLAIGATLGLLCGVLLANVLASQLVGVDPTDWQIWLPSVLMLLMVSLVALAVPALRAARADILAVMRRD